ncbi:MAG TPA: hypothetical protein VFX60_19425 [Micromonospora sp.]|nr:hypothetical protein [Micromonospora sp.]
MAAPESFSAQAGDFALVNLERDEWTDLLRPLFWRRWLQQGRPTDFPVALVPPTITGQARKEGAASVLDAGTVTIADATWSFALCRQGVLSGTEFAIGVVQRFPVLATFPDGHQEIMRPRRIWPSS